MRVPPSDHVRRSRVKALLVAAPTCFAIGGISTFSAIIATQFPGSPSSTATLVHLGFAAALGIAPAVALIAAGRHVVGALRTAAFATGVLFAAAGAWCSGAPFVDNLAQEVSLAQRSAQPLEPEETTRSLDDLRVEADSMLAQTVESLGSVALVSEPTQMDETSCHLSNLAWGEQLELHEVYLTSSSEDEAIRAIIELWTTMGYAPVEFEAGFVGHEERGVSVEHAGWFERVEARWLYPIDEAEPITRNIAISFTSDCVLTERGEHAP